MKSTINKLKEIALRFQIDPVETIGHAAKVNTVIKVLSDINRSYNNFLEIEFLKNPSFKIALSKNSKILETIKEELDLLIVDVKFSSFETAVAPNIVDNQAVLFNDEVKAWKSETFRDYKKTIIMGDYSSTKHLKKIVDRYSAEERLKIFQPFFSSIGDGKAYKINIKGLEGKTIQSLYQPEKSKFYLYIPKILPVQNEFSTEKNYVAYLKIKKEGEADNIKLNKKSIKKVHYIEEMSNDIYPFKPDILQYSNLIFSLNSKIDCKVSFEEENYVIECAELDIIVWGDSREKAEEAFGFSFCSLYKNFYLEDDKSLSKEAILLKGKLKLLIKSVFENEAKKK